MACHNSAASLLTNLESEEEFQTFQDLVPSMLSVARTCIETGDETTVAKVSADILWIGGIFAGV